jgi:hypothetical protein
MQNTTHRTIAEIEADLVAAGRQRDRFRAIINEGQGGYTDESKIESLIEELHAAQDAACPLNRDIAGERAWFNAQGFRSVIDAERACRARGYSMQQLKDAIKAASN